MAKDGTNRGGARPGTGRKPKVLTEKISEGKVAEVLMEPAALEGADVPPVKDFLKSPQKSGRELVAEEVYKETFVWLKARGCDSNVINLKQPLNGRQNVWKYQKGEGKRDSDGREKDVG